MTIGRVYLSSRSAHYAVGQMQGSPIDGLCWGDGVFGSPNPAAVESNKRDNAKHHQILSMPNNSSLTLSHREVGESISYRDSRSANYKARWFQLSTLHATPSRWEKVADRVTVEFSRVPYSNFVWSCPVLCACFKAHVAILPLDHVLGREIITAGKIDSEPGKGEQYRDMVRFRHVSIRGLSTKSSYEGGMGC